MSPDFINLNQLTSLRTEKAKAYVNYVMAGRCTEETMPLLEEIKELNNKLTQYREICGNGNPSKKQEAWMSKQTGKIMHT